MTIACTRCGATEDGNIISAPIAFAFKHEVGCAHGVGPLAVLPSGFKKKFKTSETEYHKVEGKSAEHLVVDEAKEDIKVEEKVKEKPKKSVKEKIRVFGKKE